MDRQLFVYYPYPILVFITESTGAQKIVFCLGTDGTE